MAICSECKNLDDEQRKTFHGKFIELTDGVTHYETKGSENGAVVVMVNGFSIPMYIWENNFHVLAKAGYHVIRYDLFGRGGSDRYPGRHDIELYTRQLSELISALVPGKKINIFGICMGGIITANYISENPDKIKSALFIGPAGFKGSQPSSNWFAQVPVFGDFIMQSMGGKELVSSLSHHLYKFKDFPEYKQKYFHQMEYRGFLASLLSCMRNMPLESSLPIYEEVGRNNLPTTVIWGDQDQLVDIKYLDTFLSAVPHAEGYIIENSGHVCNYEDAELVNELLLDHLKAHTK